MMKPTTYNCPNCGAPIRYTEICPYCGSHIEWIPTHGVKFVYARADAFDLNSEVVVDLADLKSGIVSKDMILHELVRGIGEQILPFMTILENDNLMKFSREYRGTLKVVKIGGRGK